VDESNVFPTIIELFKAYKMSYQATFEVEYQGRFRGIKFHSHFFRQNLGLKSGERKGLPKAFTPLLTHLK
jgi:hypothetical protein